MKPLRKKTEYSAHDALLFEQLSRIDAPAVQSILRGDRAQERGEKKKFLDGEIDNPRFSYDHISEEYLSNTQENLNALREEVSHSPADVLIAEAYSNKIEYLSQEINLLHAARNGNDQIFDQINQRLYGAVDVDLFRAVLGALERRVGKLVSESETIDPSTKELQRELERIALRIDSDTARQFEWYFLSEYEDLIGADEIREIFREVKKDLGLVAWKINVDQTNTLPSITVRRREKLVLIPSQRTLPRRKALALAHHELEVHAKRSENGYKSSIKLLSVGLDYYLSAEEGLAKYLETQHYAAGLNSALESYFFTALILGVDGYKRSFREVFDLASLFYKSVHYERFKNDPRPVHMYAWGRTMRLFRGTSGQNKGVCSRRGLVYLEGYMRIKDLLEQKKFSIEELLLGKYDPSNAGHVRLLKKMNIL